MNPTFAVALRKFAVDLLTAGGAAAVTAALALNFQVTDPKTLAVAAIAGFANGVINAARRYMVNAVTP